MLDFYENRIFDSLDKSAGSGILRPDEPDFVFTLAQVSARAEKYKEAAEAYEIFANLAANRRRTTRPNQRT